MQLLHPQRCPIVALRRVGAHDRRNLGRAASSVRSDSWLRPPCISGGIRYPGWVTSRDRCKLRGTWVGCRFSCGRCSSGLD